MLDQQRQLAAIFFTDIVGYTALMQHDEKNAVIVIKHYIDTIQKTVPAYGGTLLNDYGDGSLCSFPSAIHSIQCAIEVQNLLRNPPQVPLRIGLHTGEIFFENGKVLGDAVNVASRIQSLGQANTILFSKEIFDKIRNYPEFKAISLGMFDFKNVNDPVEVFALSGNGLSIPKREAMTGKLKEIEEKHNSNKRKKWLIATTICMVLLLASLFIYTRFSKSQASSAKQISIAVLPFKNESVDKEKNEPFCNGMMLALLKSLTWMNKLQPIAAQSMEKYRDTKMSIPDISKELGGIKYIVEASVQRDNNDVQISAALIDAENGQQIWADDFPGKMENVFSLQQDIAQKIANALQIKITPQEKNLIDRIPTKNTNALDAYNDALKTYVHLVYSFHSTWTEDIASNSGIYNDYSKTLAQCDHAIELDSLFAEPYVLKAKAYNYKAQNFYSSPGLADTIAAVCNKALSLNAGATDAYVLLSDYFFIKGRADSGIKVLEKAAGMDPNSFEVNWALGNYYASDNQEQAIHYFKKALRLDPLSVWTPLVYTDFAWVYANLCDFKMNEFYLKKAMQGSNNSSVTAHTLFSLDVMYNHINMPDSVIKYGQMGVELNDKNALYQMAEAYCYLKNNCEKAVQLYEELWNKYHDHNNQHRWAIALWKTGKNNILAQQLFDSSFSFYKRAGPLTYDLAGMYAYKGDKENAMRILKQFNWNWGSPYLAQYDPLFDKIRNDKDFKDLLQKVLDDKAKERKRIKQLEAEGNL